MDADGFRLWSFITHISGSIHATSNTGASSGLRQSGSLVTKRRYVAHQTDAGDQSLDGGELPPLLFRHTLCVGVLIAVGGG